MILLTGGLGFIGSHICVEILNQTSEEVVIVDNLANADIKTLDKIEIITNKKPKFYQIDLNNKEKLDFVFKNNPIKAVIHLAGHKAVGESVQYPLKYYHNNLMSTISLLDIMAQYNCFKIIFSSSATIYGNSQSPITEIAETGRGITNTYGRTKYFIEKMLKDMTISNQNWQVISLRYFNPIGAHHSGLIGEDPRDIPNNLMPFLIRVALQNNTSKHLDSVYDKLKVFGADYPTKDGTGERDYIDIIDLAQAHLMSLNYFKSGYHYYNVGTGKSTSVLELVKIFEQTNNVKIPYQITQKRKGDLTTIYCDPKKINQEFQWKSQYSLGDSCKNSWNFIQKNYLS